MNASDLMARYYVQDGLPHDMLMRIDHDQSCVIAELPDGWSALELFEAIAADMQREIGEPTISRDAIPIDQVNDGLSLAAGAAMSPVGVLATVVFEFSTSAKPGESQQIVLALPPQVMRELRPKVVQALGTAIDRAETARRQRRG